MRVAAAQRAGADGYVLINNFCMSGDGSGDGGRPGGEPEYEKITGLPQEWVVKRSRSTGAPYYLNTRTGFATWCPPMHKPVPERSATPPVPVPPKPPPPPRCLTWADAVAAFVDR